MPTDVDGSLHLSLPSMDRLDKQFHLYVLYIQEAIGQSIITKCLETHIVNSVFRWLSLINYIFTLITEKLVQYTKWHLKLLLCNVSFHIASKPNGNTFLLNYMMTHWFSFKIAHCNVFSSEIVSYKAVKDGYICWVILMDTKKPASLIYAGSCQGKDLWNNHCLYSITTRPWITRKK